MRLNGVGANPGGLRKERCGPRVSLYERRSMIVPLFGGMQQVEMHVRGHRWF